MCIDGHKIETNNHMVRKRINCTSIVVNAIESMFGNSYYIPFLAEVE